jgi:hypothetical protein
VNGWIDDAMDGWMEDGWVDGWMDGFITKNYLQHKGEVDIYTPL